MDLLLKPFGCIKGLLLLLSSFVMFLIHVLGNSLPYEATDALIPLPFSSLLYTQSFPVCLCFD